MRRTYALTLGQFVFTAVALCAIQARAETAPRTELLTYVSVSGDQLSLSDLLPRSAPESLRSEAASVPLGRAPQPGRERLIGRTEVVRALIGHGEALNSLIVPDRIAVASAARPITADEAYQAILAQLRKSDSPAAESLRAQDVQLGAQVFVRPGDAGLRVTRMDFDPILGRARFLLWPANDPEVVPFFATVRLDAVSQSRLLGFQSPTSQPVKSPLVKAIASVPAQLAPEANATKRSISEKAARAAVRQTLVQPGQPSVLTLQNAAMQITVDVAPLERGSLGQRIRVRMTGTGKIVTAEVIGRARLEAQL